MWLPRPLPNRDALLAVLVAAYDAGFKAGKEGHDLENLPRFRTGVEIEMWTAGWCLAHELRLQAEYQAR